MHLVATPAKLTARAALRLQACINAVALAIIANSIALDSVLKAVCTASVHYSSQRWWCLEKNNWVDSEGALSAVAIAVIFTLDHVSLSSFTALVIFTTFVATRRCRCLLQSVRMNVMPWRLLFVISGILAGGIPGFCIELCCFPHLLNWPMVFLWRVLFYLLIVWPSVIMAHKMSVCMHRDDTKLSSLALIVFVSPINWNLSRHCSVVCVVFWFVCFCVWVFCLVSWMSVTVHRTMYRSSTSLLLRPLQQRPLRDLINQLINPNCNMLLNMLNDLAEATKASDEKKKTQV